MSAEGPIHSTGRGGAGNVGHDNTEYTDGGIVREGIVGAGEGDYSTGRGGAGNIVEHPEKRPSMDIVPKVNEIPHEGHEDFHTGRGGGGNVHKEKYGGHSHDPNKLSLLDKAKSFLTGKKKEAKHTETKTETPAPTSEAPST
ncbi:uncharacterized protein PV09_01738 [Verruconis gallopava]|uniref:Uncharacterized protein n=1 Tax=Verruconis gallopava TaxID=253628 RepID=A0A0D2B991_9PEZI|nr:uncharacterized protein PV09_01738 [Verruconis gallopava]KIW07819.1 hypothetical protein PV09_01738 [Verruconis gallopava]